MNLNETSSRRRLSLQIAGHVQGVGFRFTTVEVARDFSITGYVQNMLDGSVKVIAEGEEPELMRFLDALRASHVFRYVAEENLSWLPATGELEDFTIRYA